MLRQETIIRDLALLERATAGRDDADLEEVKRDLERAAGATVRRAAAARLLGVSQTALDRWIRSGDVPVVPTVDGRREVPVPALVRLVARVRERQAAGARNALADELHEHRRRADALSLDNLLADAVDTARPHRKAELSGLAYHRAVAQLLDENGIRDAARRLRRWHDEGRLLPGQANAWAALLARPLPELTTALAADEPTMRDLRQSSPFAGFLDEPARRRVLAAVADATR